MENTVLLNRVLLSEQVADILTASIINGEYEIGEKLPTESSLCERFDVSRTVIREAMKLLKQKGLVASRPAKGTFVISNLDKGIGESIHMMLTNLPESGQEELIELRFCIEPEFAALAADKAEEEDLKQLRDLLKEMAHCLNELDKFSDLDMKFHMGILSATRNTMMISFMMPIFENIHQQQYEHIKMKSEAILTSFSQHQKIYLALEARDPDQARICVQEHINSVREDFKRLEASRPEKQ